MLNIDQYLMQRFPVYLSVATRREHGTTTLTVEARFKTLGDNRETFLTSIRFTPAGRTPKNKSVRSIHYVQNGPQSESVNYILNTPDHHGKAVEQVTAILNRCADYHLIDRPESPLNPLQIAAGVYTAPTQHRQQEQ